MFSVVEICVDYGGVYVVHDYGGVYVVHDYGGVYVVHVCALFMVSFFIVVCKWVVGALLVVVCCCCELSECVNVASPFGCVLTLSYFRWTQCVWLHLIVFFFLLWHSCCYCLP